MADAPPLSARLTVEGPLGELPRFGINLGVRTVWGAEQLMSNVLRNPGLEPALDGALIVVGRTDFTGVEDDSRWTARPEDFWAGARFEVLSGPAAGQQGQVLGNRRTSAVSPDRLTLSPMPAGVGPGDAIAVRGQQDAAPAPLWWTEGRLRSVHDTRPGSPGQRSVLLQAMPGQQASLLHHLDSIGARAGKLLPVNGEWHLSLWVRGETDDARLQLSFGRHGQNPWLNQTLKPGRSWTRIELPFKTRDDGPPGPLQLAIRAVQGALLVDDLALGASAAQASPGGFRTEVVQNLRALRPGYLRDWQGQLADLPAKLPTTAASVSSSVSAVAVSASARHDVRAQAQALEQVYRDASRITVAGLAMTLPFLAWFAHTGQPAGVRQRHGRSAACASSGRGQLP